MSDKCSKELFLPHSLDVIERETSDNGFSKGWGMHFAPVAENWVDTHTHVWDTDIKNAVDLIDTGFKGFSKLDVKRIVAISPEVVREDEVSAYAAEKILTGFENACTYLVGMQKVNNALPFLHLSYTMPDPKLIEEAVKIGIYGIKLHNAPVITHVADPEVWLNKEWCKAFEIIAKHDLPVLWHVTQRLTDSPYTGGGRNTYWNEGWEKGVTYTNKDLLQIFLKVVERYPKIRFIAAHQLHLGWDSLTDLFDSHANLYTDTTVGCFVRKDYVLYDLDREYLRNVFTKYCDRIIFGTDLIIERGMTERYIEDTYSGHMRFIIQLSLSDEAIQKISHGNLEKILGIRLLRI